MVQLEQVTDAIVAALKRVGPGTIEIVDNTLVIEVQNPAQENPALVAAITAVGGRVQFVTEVSPTLEDVYLKLVRS